MKDFIYLDTELANSYLAQIDEGLRTKIVSGQAMTLSLQEGTSKNGTKEGTTSAGIPGTLGGTVKVGTQTSKTSAKSSAENNSELVETALNDYVIDFLIERLKENGLKEHLSESQEGDFILADVPFRFYDFEFMGNSIDNELFEILGLVDSPKLKANSSSKKKDKNNKQVQSKVKEINAHRQDSESQNAIEGINMIGKLAKFGRKLFPNTVLLSNDGYLAICSRDSMRISQSQLSFISDSKRNIKILATVLNVKDKVNINGDIGDFQSVDLNIITPLFSELILGNFDLLKSNDRIIRPVAIYFESDLE